MTELGKMKVLGYHAEHGKSGYRVKCECGRVQFVYCWSGRMKCECGKILSIRYSPEAKEIVVTAEDLGIKSVPQVKVTAPCITCRKELEYVHGVGWKHSPASVVGDSKVDHPALPAYQRIKKAEEKKE